MRTRADVAFEAKMITHTLTLDEINKGFDLMHAGKDIRSVVVF